jgi:Tol biopolymer transport system component
VAFNCTQKSVQDLCIKSLTDGRDTQLLYASPSWKSAGSFTAGDESLLFSDQNAETREDLLLLPLDGKGAPQVVLRTPFEEDNPEASRDGRWIAYTADETGRGEIYVRASSGGYQQWQISSAGGSQPRWSANGKELFYLAPDGNVMSAAIEVAPVFRPAAPKALFKLPKTPDRDTPIFEDVTPDGQRMLLNVPVTERSSVGFDVILNWTSLLNAQD